MRWARRDTFNLTRGTKLQDAKRENHHERAGSRNALPVHPRLPSAHGLHCKRRRAGVRHVRILLHVTPIQVLIRKFDLQPDQRENAKALQGAVSDRPYELSSRST